jgi:RNA polymerase nonessential primary-like sigma factor
MSKSAKPTVDSVRQYLQEIGRYPLLTHEQEIAYGKQVQRMVQLNALYNGQTEQRSQPLTKSEWATIAGLSESELEKALETGARAKRRLVEANLRLVVSVAKKYQKLNMEMLDLLQEGGIGLQRAAEKFDPTKGYRFSTYSYWWIRQAMTRALSEQSRTIRLPVHMTEKLGKIKKAQRQLAAQLGRPATIGEIASVLEMKPEQVRDCLFQSRQPISLDIKIGNEQNTELGDLLEDDGQTPDDFATVNCLKEDLERWLLDLTPQQQQVIRMRYGLTNNEPMTLQQISTILNLTRERIRQIEKAALKRLQQRQENMSAYLAG